jgi:hypothetical protein
VVRMTSVIVFESTVDVAMYLLISMKMFSISIVGSQVMYKNKSAQTRSRDGSHYCGQATRQPPRLSVCDPQSEATHTKPCKCSEGPRALAQLRPGCTCFACSLFYKVKTALFAGSDLVTFH